MRKELTIYVEALTKEEAIGVAYLQVTEDYSKPMFVKFLWVEEIKPE